MAINYAVEFSAAFFICFFQSFPLRFLLYRCKALTNHRQATLEELDGCLPDRSQDLEKALEAGLLKESINSFLSSVSRSDCTLFLGLCYYGLTIRELAGKLRRPPSAPGGYCFTR